MSFIVHTANVTPHQASARNARQEAVATRPAPTQTLGPLSTATFGRTAPGAASASSVGLRSPRAAPFADGVADAVVAGWAIARAVGWQPGDWRPRVDAALAEMGRVARAHAPQIVIETLGAGTVTLAPPTKLRPFYDHLEARGFARGVIRTDYRFAAPRSAMPDHATSYQLIGFFFGAEVADRFAGSRVATGIHRRLGARRSAR